MVKCPNCGKKYDKPIGEIEDNTCPDCGRSLLPSLPGYPNRFGKDTKNSLLTAWRIFSSNFSQIILFLAIPTLIVFALNSMAFWQYEMPVYFELLTGRETIESIERYQFMELFLYLIANTFLIWIFQLACLGGIVSLSKRSFVGLHVNFKDGLKTVKDSFLKLIVVSTILIVVITGGFVISGMLILFTEHVCAGGILLLVSALLGVLFLTWFLYTIPIMVLERKGVIPSIIESKKIGKRRGGTFKLFLLLFFLVNILSYPFNFAPQIIYSPTYYQLGIFQLILQFGLRGFLFLFQYMIFGFSMILISTHYMRLKHVQK